MFKKITFFCLLILFITNCKDKLGPVFPSHVDNVEKVQEKKTPATLIAKDKSLEIVSTVDEFKNIIEYSRRKSDFAKQGTYVLSSKKGEVLEIAQYENDTLEGKRVLFYAEVGDTQIIETYHHGQFEGSYRVYHSNGNLEQEGVYIANMMEGTWKRFYETGELMEEVLFEDNNENGPFKEYYVNGNLKAEGYYKNGDNEHGSLKLYNQEGELIKTMNCVKGICKTIWKQGEDM